MLDAYRADAANQDRLYTAMRRLRVDIRDRFKSTLDRLDHASDDYARLVAEVNALETSLGETIDSKPTDLTDPAFTGLISEESLQEHRQTASRIESDIRAVFEQQEIAFDGKKQEYNTSLEYVQEAFDYLNRKAPLALRKMIRDQVWYQELFQQRQRLESHAVSMATISADLNEVRNVEQQLRTHMETFQPYIDSFNQVQQLSESIRSVHDVLGSFSTAHIRGLSYLTQETRARVIATIDRLKTTVRYSGDGSSQLLMNYPGKLERAADSMEFDAHKAALESFFAGTSDLTPDELVAQAQEVQQQLMEAKQQFTLHYDELAEKVRVKRESHTPTIESSKKTVADAEAFLAGLNFSDKRYEQLDVILKKMKEKRNEIEAASWKLQYGLREIELKQSMDVLLSFSVDSQDAEFTSYLQSLPNYKQNSPSLKRKLVFSRVSNRCSHLERKKQHKSPYPVLIQMC